MVEPTRPGTGPAQGVTGERQHRTVPPASSAGVLLRAAAHVAAVLMGAVLTAAVLTATASAGSALTSPGRGADGPEVVELSADGLSYSRSLGDLFGPITLVPLDVAGDSFWVRNAGEEPAHLTVLATDVVVSDPAAAAAITLSAGPSSGPPAPNLSLGQPGACLVLSSGWTLSPGESVEIVSRLGLADLDGTRGQGAHIGFSVQVVLSDEDLVGPGGSACGGTPPETPETEVPEIEVPQTATPGPSGGSGSDGAGSGDASGSGALAVTGAAVALAVLLAMLLVAGGAVVLCFVRRRREDDDTVQSIETEGRDAGERRGTSSEHTS